VALKLMRGRKNPIYGLQPDELSATIGYAQRHPSRPSWSNPKIVGTTNPNVWQTIMKK